MTLRVAIMQPYFFPYAGYFRLMAQSDLFVILDDVQFPRRGRVHRCEIAPGTWLTLPLARAARDTRINRLDWAPEARTSLDARLAGAGIDKAVSSPLHAHLFGPLPSVPDFLERGLRLVTELLGLSVRFMRSSALDLPAGLRGQNRILAILDALGASHYINAPGGRDLYQAHAFAAHGMTLEFLPPYRGAFPYLLPELLLPGAGSRIRADIDREAVPGERGR